jgi:hypothetical protein
MLLGGVAVLARGVRWMTTDIDAVVRGDEVEPAALLAVLRGHGIEPRIPDALGFAETSLVLLLRHVPTGVDLDVSLWWSSFEHEAIAAATPARFGAVTAPMATAEDLVIFKGIAGRPKDMDDAEALLLLHPNIDVERVRRFVRVLAELAEAEHLPGQLDAVIARAGRD